MGQFVGQHAGRLFLAEAPQQALRHRNGGVVGIAAGGEGVRLVVLHHVDLGHGQFGLLGQLADQPDQRGRLTLADFSRAVHAQDQLVGVPVGESVHGERQDEGDHQPRFAAKHEADGEKQAGEAG